MYSSIVAVTVLSQRRQWSHTVQLVVSHDHSSTLLSVLLVATDGTEPRTFPLHHWHGPGGVAVGYCGATHGTAGNVPQCCTTTLCLQMRRRRRQSGLRRRVRAVAPDLATTARHGVHARCGGPQPQGSDAGTRTRLSSSGDHHSSHARACPTVTGAVRCGRARRTMPAPGAPKRMYGNVFAGDPHRPWQAGLSSKML